MTTGTLPVTPGYNTHLEIFFKPDKRGRKAAYRMSQMRAIRISLADAELFIAQGQATQLDGHPMKSLTD